MTKSEILREQAEKIRTMTADLHMELSKAANIVEGGDVPVFTVLDEGEIIFIANACATRYTNRHTPELTSYGFMQHDLVKFARRIMHAAAKKGTV